MWKSSLLVVLFITNNLLGMDSNSNIFQHAYNLLDQPGQAALKNFFSTSSIDKTFKIANPSMRLYENIKRKLGTKADLQKLKPTNKAVAFSYGNPADDDKVSVIIATDVYFFTLPEIDKILRNIKFNESYEGSVNAYMFDMEE